MRQCTYLHSWLCAYKTGNISETVEDRAKVTINGLYKVVHALSIAAEMYDLEWPLSEIQSYWFFKCRKMTKYSLVMTPTQCTVAESIISIRPTDSCARTLTYLLTYLLTYTEQPVFLATGLWSSFLTSRRMICLPSTAFGRPRLLIDVFYG